MSIAIAGMLDQLSYRERRCVFSAEGIPISGFLDKYSVKHFPDPC
jgi:hypothetical protein